MRYAKTSIWIASTWTTAVFKWWAVFIHVYTVIPYKSKQSGGKFFSVSLPIANPLSCQQREKTKNKAFSSPVFPLKEGVNSLGYTVWCWFPISSGGRKSTWLSMLPILNYTLIINNLFTTHSKPLVSLEKFVSYQLKRIFFPSLHFSSLFSVFHLYSTFCFLTVTEKKTLRSILDELNYTTFWFYYIFPAHQIPWC